ncbi:MAG TPA: pyruvate dehydrogenase (acetyl-transferring), homodimeric type, partial [Ottowia sp.]|nr:pyruvate dehydrogenase (acetyl-transferring), homodimeric type [Ottowia sp.]
AFAGEMAVIVDAGMREMMVEQKDVFYYVTLMNENYAQPDLPEGAHEGVLRGCYLFGSYRRTSDGRELPKDAPTVTLMGSGAILTEVILAAELLVRQGIAASVLSVTSWSELARDGQACERRQLDGDVAAGTPWVTQVLAGTRGPVIAATDYVCAVPESVRAFVPEGRRYLTLGTDGFGRSDTRAALRRFFGVDAKAVVRAARRALG